MSNERPNYIQRANEREVREQTPANHIFAFGALPYKPIRYRPAPIVKQLFPEYVHIY